MTTSLQLSAAPAHKTWVELHTRIASQDLHFRSGREEAAIDSLVDTFKSTRALMRENIGAYEFLYLADFMLRTIRPYTARWHTLIGDDKLFVSPAAKRQFRGELQELQPKLKALAGLFEKLGKSQSITMPEMPAARLPNLGPQVPLGICESHSAPENAAAIDASEHKHVKARRQPSANGALYNGVGLALSGGGIRSATFCLGVVQVLAQQKLLSRFDYLSTVSGGGYLGSFISNQFSDAGTTPQPLDVGFDPGREEAPPIRHLRNSSKYLLPTSTWDALKLGGQLFSGVLTTLLLTVAIPIFAALLVRIVAHFFDFRSTVQGVLWGVAALSGLVVALCWLARPLKIVSRPRKSWLDAVSASFGSLAVLALALGFTPTMLDALHDWHNWKIVGFAASSVGALLTGAVAIKALHAAWKYRRALSRLFMFSGGVLYLVVYLWFVDTLGLERGGFSISLGEGVVAGCLVAWAFWAHLINLNDTGLHRYYRDRLAACYLAAGAKPRSVPTPPALIALSSHLPYHLINTTVNLASSKQPELRGRGGDFFLLSKFYCGSPLLGYRETAKVIAANPDLDLATAMAISGAAASTNMGWQTMHDYRTLMAVLNLRLGYWMKWREGLHPFGSSAFGQLLNEIRGKLDEKSVAINLSDGGHIENLATYELIRRKMRFIVCVDGGMDPEMTCADLNRLQRLVAIDFGYRMDFDVANFSLRQGYSGDYGLLVKIDYSPDQPQAQKELGWMLYIKLAMLGTESNYVMDYRRENPQFPHQTTADQFFDEAQFEAYRKLGETAASNFFRAPFLAPTHQEVNAGTGFEKWFESLAGNMLLDTDPVFS